VIVYDLKLKEAKEEEKKGREPVQMREGEDKQMMYLIFTH